MVKCAVPCCKNDSRRQNKTNSDVTYHRFPKCIKLINKWIKAIERPDWEPHIQSRVCSIHFNPSSISETNKGFRILVKGAIPELKLKNITNNELEKDAPLEYSKSLVNEERQKRNDAPTIRKLKREIRSLKKLAERRRLRCNTLYVQINRDNKKIATLTNILSQFREKESITNMRHLQQGCSND